MPKLVIASFLVVVSLVGLYLRWRILYGVPPAGAPSALCYHKISRRFRLEGTWTTPRRFLDQIDFLRERGYRFITEDEFYAGLSSPSHERAREVLLTFDDGYEEIHDVFLEHLAPRRIPVLVFLVAEYAGRTNDWDLSLGRPPARHLSWNQVARMAREGAAFGSHGARHIDLTRASADAVKSELDGSRRLIADKTGADVKSFSYPFGRYDARVSAAVRRAGYAGAFSLYPRHSNGVIDRYAMRRNGVYVIDTRLTLRWKLEDGPFFWFEEMKCRTINSVAVLTPILKRPSPDPDR
jgi:peptidoglycan/xylan/chitin deacetylase (PgdA/CDA1 family)